MSVEEVGITQHDLVPQWLEGEPPGHRVPGAVTGVARSLIVDQERRTGRFGQELRLAGALHSDEPPGRLVDGLSHGEQAVIAMDGGLVWSQTGGQGLGGRLFEHDGPTALATDGVVFEEHTGVLSNRVELSPERGPGLAVNGMGVCRRNTAGSAPRTSRVNAKAAWLTGRFPSTTSPSWLTRIRS